MAHWNGDEWRWRIGQHRYASQRSISVIDTAEQRPEPSGPVQRVPFGFGIREPQREVEPLLWEGED